MSWACHCKGPHGEVSAGRGTQRTLPQTGPEPLSGSDRALKLYLCKTSLWKGAKLFLQSEDFINHYLGTPGHGIHDLFLYFPISPWFNPEIPSFPADFQVLGALVSSWAWQTVTEIFTQTQYYACKKQTQTTEVVGANKMLTCSISDKNELFVYKENPQYLEKTEYYCIFWRLWSFAKFS